MKKLIWLTFVFILFFSFLSAQNTTIKIWKDVDNKTLSKQKSKLYIFQPSDSIKNDVAVIICPGGSYHHLGMPHEGFKTAEWFNSIGVTAFVLRYRTSGRGFHHPAMIEDMQRSIELVRKNAADYGINPDKIGTIGFSAGGHLVLMAGAFGGDNYLEKKGLKTDISLYPNFVIPIYPVVSMQDSLAHQWSRKSLLGKTVSQADKDHFSMEMQMTDKMPPVFLLASKDDPVVDYRNSLVLSKSLENNHVKHKFLLYDTGGHGYGMKKTEFTETTRWNWILRDWLIEIEMIAAE
ncbi:MAG: alpha/beta hydrolase [Bacteroidales bacterium]|nr:alpha/beta hydrolase [Bacteroidales bacterium]